MARLRRAAQQRPPEAGSAEEESRQRPCIELFVRRCLTKGEGLEEACEGLKELAKASWLKLDH